MSDDDIPVRQKRVKILFGVAMCCFVGALLLPEDTNTEIAIGLGAVIVGVVCMVIAGKIAKSLKSESAAK